RRGVFRPWRGYEPEREGCAISRRPSDNQWNKLSIHRWDFSVHNILLHSSGTVWGLLPLPGLPLLRLQSVNHVQDDWYAPVYGCCFPKQYDDYLFSGCCGAGNRVGLVQAVWSDWVLLG